MADTDNSSLPIPHAKVTLSQEDTSCEISTRVEQSNITPVHQEPDMDVDERSCILHNTQSQVQTRHKYCLRPTQLMEHLDNDSHLSHLKEVGLNRID